MSDNNNLHLGQIQQAGLSNFITLLIWWYLTMESLTTHNILFYVRRWRTKKEKSTVWFHLNIYFFRSTSKYVVLMPQRKKYALMQNGFGQVQRSEKKKKKKRESHLHVATPASHANGPAILLILARLCQLTGNPPRAFHFKSSKG